MQKEKYDFVYQSALKATSFEDLKATLKNVYLDERQQSFTVAAHLAIEGKVDKVDWLRQLGANVHNIAKAYAIAGNHEQVELYRTQHGADFNGIAQGYAIADNHERVEMYRAKPHIDLSTIAQGYAIAGNHQLVEVYRTQHEADVNYIAQGYAMAGNLKKVEFYQTEHKAHPDAIVQGFVMVGNQDQVEIYRTHYGVDAHLIAQGYAIAGTHEKVEELRIQHGSEVINTIARGYAIVGNYRQVEIYRRLHGANVNLIAQGYAMAGSHEQVEHYRTRHGASVHAIIQGYAITGNHKRFEEYHTVHGANIAGTYDMAATPVQMSKIINKTQEAAIKTLQKHINELEEYGQALKDLSYDEDVVSFDETSKEFIKGNLIITLAQSLNTELETFIEWPITEENFNSFSTKFTEALDANKDSLQTHRDEWVPYAVIAGNILFALTGLGALILAGNAIYVSTTREGLTLHSGFFGMRTASEKQALEIESDFQELRLFDNRI